MDAWVKDRIVQTAVKFALEPIFEATFLPSSCGFRPARGCKDALKEVDRLIRDGYTFVVDADLKSCFDSIPHGRLMERVAARVSDGRRPGAPRKGPSSVRCWRIFIFIRRRLRAILRKWEKRGGLGICPAATARWPNAFFAQAGLFTLKDAHLAARNPR